jgi:hypothetical protein
VAAGGTVTGSFEVEPARTGEVRPGVGLEGLLILARMRARDRERQRKSFELGQQLEELRAAGGGGVRQRLRFEVGREEDLTWLQ